MTTRPPDADPTPPRDPAFDAAWRAASHEAPPAALDDAIRAAARRAVDAGPRRVPEATRPERWWWPLAAAATIGAVAIGILQLMPDRAGAPGDESAIVTDMPATAPSGPASGPASIPSAAPSAAPPVTPEAARPIAPAVAPSAPPRNAAQLRAREPQAKTEAEAHAPAPARDSSAMPAAVPPVPTSPPTAKSVAAEPAAASAGVAAPSRIAQPFPADAGERRETRADLAGPREMAAAGSPAPAPGRLAAGPAAEQGTAVRAQQGAPLPVADWIALIRKLRAEGRVDQAARELAAFRRAHPDHERLLPEDLRDWRPAEK